MLAFRIRPEIEGRRSGLLTNASGKRGERDAYGAPSRWMDYSGPIKGHGQRGIALFDHPGNTLPGYGHVRDYGLAAINPFGRRAVGRLAEGGGHTLIEGGSTHAQVPRVRAFGRRA